MSKKSITHQLYLSYLLITVLSLVLVGWYASKSFREFYLLQTTKDLTVRAQLLKQRLSLLDDTEEIDFFVKEMGEKTNTRYTVIDGQGVVLGDSEKDFQKMENHADRLEVKKALQGEPGISIRVSQTLQTEMMYVAVPLDASGEKGVVRAAIPLTEVSRLLRTIFYRIVLAGFVIAVLAAVLGWLASQRIVKPLREMRDIAERFAAGELDNRLSIPPNEEMGALAESMNLMAKQLSERIATIANQRNEIEAVLSSMTESLLAVNMDEKVIKINQAAMNLLGIEDKNVSGKSIQEVVRNTELQDLVWRCLASASPIEKQIVLRDEDEQYWQAHGTPLVDAQGKSIGALLVLSDVTKIRRLERVRSDFVANVSHELKTPITSLKGFVETLLDGALEDRENAVKFLDIMAKQSDRLNAIIEDLLSLSRIEQETEKGEIPIEEESLLPVIEAAIELCQTKLTEKDVEVTVECPASMRAKINSPMLEQALVNLIDNAIKYSPEQSAIAIKAEATESTVDISVIDKGCGIPEEHLARLFERFYRVDKARSRKLGGTGLGLAIVKHIIQSHSGTVTVASKLDSGSTFTIHLPSSKK